LYPVNIQRLHRKPGPRPGSCIDFITQQLAQVAAGMPGKMTTLHDVASDPAQGRMSY